MNKCHQSRSANLLSLKQPKRAGNLIDNGSVT